MTTHSDHIDIERRRIFLRSILPVLGVATLTISGVQAIRGFLGRESGSRLETAVATEPLPPQAATEPATIDYIKALPEARISTAQDVSDLIKGINRSDITTHDDYVAVHSAYSRALDTSKALKEDALQYLVLNYRARTLRDAQFNLIPRGEKSATSLGNIASESRVRGNSKLYNLIKAFADYESALRLIENREQGFNSPYAGLGSFGTIATPHEVRARMVETINEMGLAVMNTRYVNLVPKMTSARNALLDSLPTENARGIGPFPFSYPAVHR
jgi:hypothetical protein